MTPNESFAAYVCLAAFVIWNAYVAWTLDRQEDRIRRLEQGPTQEEADYDDDGFDGF